MKNQKAIKVLFFSTFMALSRIFILKNRKATLYVTLRFFSKSRSDVIRTRDLYVPNVALYQAEPHSDNRTGQLTVRLNPYSIKELRIEDSNLY